jgi:hypothetical protein
MTEGTGGRVLEGGAEYAKKALSSSGLWHGVLGGLATITVLLIAGATSKLLLDRPEDADDQKEFAITAERSLADLGRDFNGDLGNAEALRDIMETGGDAPSVREKWAAYVVVHGQYYDGLKDMKATLANAPMSAYRTADRLQQLIKINNLLVGSTHATFICLGSTHRAYVTRRATVTAPATATASVAGDTAAAPAAEPTDDTPAGSPTVSCKVGGQTWELDQQLTTQATCQRYMDTQLRAIFLAIRREQKHSAFEALRDLGRSEEHRESEEGQAVFWQAMDKGLPEACPEGALSRYAKAGNR